MNRHPVRQTIGLPGIGERPALKLRQALQATIAFALLAVLFTAGCEQREDAPAEARLVVMTTLFPLYDFVRQVGGDRVDVRLLLPPGVESHGFEPRPEDIVQVNNASVFVYTNALMEPWAAQIVKSAGRERGLLVIDSSAGVRFLALASKGAGQEGRGGTDPHIWLSIPNAKKMVENIAAGLAAGDPAGAPLYARNAAAYQAGLDRLDGDFRRGLADCRTRLFLHGGHSAFGYLADQYGLQYVAAYPATADTEPSPRRLMEMITLMKRDAVKYIFYEELIAPRAAKVIADEAGASLLRLHGLHNVGRDDIAAGATYRSLMTENLDHLRRGLQCR